MIMLSLAQLAVLAQPTPTDAKVSALVCDLSRVAGETESAKSAKARIVLSFRNAGADEFKLGQSDFRFADPDGVLLGGILRGIGGHADFPSKGHRLIAGTTETKIMVAFVNPSKFGAGWAAMVDKLDSPKTHKFEGACEYYGSAQTAPGALPLDEKR